jgi:hypothetical protein
VSRVSEATEGAEMAEMLRSASRERGDDFYCHISEQGERDYRALRGPRTQIRLIYCEVIVQGERGYPAIAI